MRKIDFDNIKESTEGGFDRLPAGNYECMIVGAKDEPGSEYVRLLIDICGGEHTGFFSSSFYADKPWAHQVIMSYKDSATQMLKGRLHVITDCNPGFDAEAAWNGGDPEKFVGKNVGVCFNLEEYEAKDGSIRSNAKAGALVRLTDIRSGSAKPARCKTIDGKWVSVEEGMRRDEARRARNTSNSAPAATVATNATDPDIPF